MPAFRPEFDRPARLPWDRYVAGMAALGLCPMAHQLGQDGACPSCPAAVRDGNSSGFSASSSTPRRYSTSSALTTLDASVRPALARA
jgi:hypothetical protein